MLDEPRDALTSCSGGTARVGGRGLVEARTLRHDGLHRRVADGTFEAACGPTNLNEAILAFVDLVIRSDA